MPFLQLICDQRQQDWTLCRTFHFKCDLNSWLMSSKGLRFPLVHAYEVAVSMTIYHIQLVLCAVPMAIYHIQLVLCGGHLINSEPIHHLLMHDVIFQKSIPCKRTKVVSRKSIFQMEISNFIPFCGFPQDGDSNRKIFFLNVLVERFLFQTK